MIVASCPLRVSLVGGSTDSPKYIEKYGEGSVISFPSTLRTYVTIHQDVFGTNSIDHNYNISYSKNERVKHVSQIQNELVRHCFEHLNVDRINCSLVSDIYSSGSGLASSSSYLQALIKAIYVWREESISEFQVCGIAEKIEKKFNPLVGRQDFYGSMGGLKRIHFHRNGTVKFEYLDTELFRSMDMYLMYTGIHRSSTAVLQSIDIDKSAQLYNDCEALYNAITMNDMCEFHNVMKNSWENKKKTSPLICQNPTLMEMDERLNADNDVISHKLCGAGNGGYFLVFGWKNVDLIKKYDTMRRIDISETGLKWENLKNGFARI